MIHTKFRGNQSTGSGEDFEGFYHKWALRPSWSCARDDANKFFVHPTHGGSIQNLALIGQAVSEMFEIVVDDGRRTPDYGTS